MNTHVRYFDVVHDVVSPILGELQKKYQNPYQQLGRVLVHQISESEGYNDAPQAYQCGNTPHL
jgi:hypothetical protein